MRTLAPPEEVEHWSLTTKLVKWASNDGQITKSKPSDVRGARFLPSATGFGHDWLRFKRYLGNVGLDNHLKPLLIGRGNRE